MVARLVTGERFVCNDDMVNLPAPASRSARSSSPIGSKPTWLRCDRTRGGAPLIHSGTFLNRVQTWRACSHRFSQQQQQRAGVQSYRVQLICARVPGALCSPSGSSCSPPSALLAGHRHRGSAWAAAGSWATAAARPPHSPLLAPQGGAGRCAESRVEAVDEARRSPVAAAADGVRAACLWTCALRRALAAAGPSVRSARACHRVGSREGKGHM